MYTILFLFGCSELIGTTGAFRTIEEDVIPSYTLPDLSTDFAEINDEYMLSIVEMNNPPKKISFLYENDQEITQGSFDLLNNNQQIFEFVSPISNFVIHPVRDFQQVSNENIERQETHVKEQIQQSEQIEQTYVREQIPFKRDTLPTQMVPMESLSIDRLRLNLESEIDNMPKQIPLIDDQDNDEEYNEQVLSKLRFLQHQQNLQWKQHKELDKQPKINKQLGLNLPSRQVIQMNEIEINQQDVVRKQKLENQLNQPSSSFIQRPNQQKNMVDIEQGEHQINLQKVLDDFKSNTEQLKTQQAVEYQQPTLAGNQNNQRIAENQNTQKIAVEKQNNQRIAENQRKTIEEIKSRPQFKTQVLTQDKLVIQSVNYDEDRLDCNVVPSGGNRACKMCNSNGVYKLDEDNWYLIGLTHNYKKEFQNLVQSLIDKVGHCDLYMSFNEENDVCLVATQFLQASDVPSILEYFEQSTLSFFSNPSIGITIPQVTELLQLEAIAVYERGIKTFKFKDLIVNLKGEFSFGDDQELQIGSIIIDASNASVRYGGRLYSDGKEIQVRLLETQNGQMSVLVRKQMRHSLQWLIQRYFGPRVGEILDDHIAKKAHSSRCNLVIISEIGDRFKITLHLTRQKML